MSPLADLGTLFLPALASFAIALLVAPVAMLICRRIGWTDKPNDRKVHEGNVPLAGGLTLVTALALAALCFQPTLSGAVYAWPCALLIFFVAFIDDRRPIRARYRFVVQLLAAFFFVTLSGLEIDALGEVVGPFAISLGVLGVPFAMIGVAGLTNAFNMMDGVDGLAGGIVLIALCWLLVIFGLIAHDLPTSARALTSTAHDASLLIALTIGALLAFLLYNQRAPWRKRAEMFLGDGGSMTVGFMVAAMLIFASTAFAGHGLTPVSAAWIAAVPLADIFTCMVRRVLTGVTPMTPDRKHVHHLLLELGVTPGGTVLLLQGVGLVTGLIGVLGWQLGIAQYLMFWGWVALFCAYFSLSQRAWARLEAGRIAASVSLRRVVPAPGTAMAKPRVEPAAAVAETTGSQPSL
jgi:UDP-GlcNAc:undecaprenyl-phosphate GlcNAc-1-phosphate transferase